MTKVLWIWGTCLKSAKLAGHWRPRNRYPNTRSGLVQDTIAKIVHQTGRRHWHTEPCVLEVCSGRRRHSLEVRAQRQRLLEFIWDDPANFVNLFIAELVLFLDQLADGWVLESDEADVVLGATPCDLVKLADDVGLATSLVAVRFELAVAVKLEIVSGVVAAQSDQVLDLVTGYRPLGSRCKGLREAKRVCCLGTGLGLPELAIGRLAQDLGTHFPDVFHGGPLWVLGVVAGGDSGLLLGRSWAAGLGLAGILALQRLDWLRRRWCRSLALVLGWHLGLLCKSNGFWASAYPTNYTSCASGWEQH